MGNNLEVARMKSLILLALLSSPVIAEIASPFPTSTCMGGVKNYELYRCVCRADIKNATGTSVTSVPLQVNGTSTIVYSPTNSLNGTACQGTMAADPCNPAVLNGAMVYGTWNCALGTTNGSTFTIK